MVLLPLVIILPVVAAVAGFWAGVWAMDKVALQDLEECLEAGDDGGPEGVPRHGLADPWRV